MKDHAPPGALDTKPNNRMRREYVFIGLTTLFLICFWMWYLFFRPSLVNPEKQAIQSKAIGELLSACNAGLVVEGVREYFRREDIEITNVQPVEGVSAYVTTLGASRNGIVCRWDGVNPVILTRGDPRRPPRRQP